ncbi:MAG: hypothetical protein WBV39_14280 [Rudaea sp.]
MTHLVHIEPVAIDTQQGTNVVDIPRASRIIDVGLQFETDQPFGTDHAQPTHAGITLLRLVEQARCRRTVRKQKVDTLIVTQIICGIFAAVNATIAEAKQQAMQDFRIGGVGQKIDVLCCSHHVVRSERQSADQGRRRRAVREERERFPDLPDDA